MRVKLSEKHRKLSSFATISLSLKSTSLSIQTHQRLNFFPPRTSSVIGETMHQGQEILVMKSRLVRTGDVNRPWKGSSDMDRISNLQ